MSDALIKSTQSGPEELEKQSVSAEKAEPLRRFGAMAAALVAVLGGLAVSPAPASAGVGSDVMLYRLDGGVDSITAPWPTLSKGGYEAVGGMISATQVAGTVPLTQCTWRYEHKINKASLTHNDNFSSLDPSCEGRQVVRRLGYIYTTPPVGRPSLAVYRCIRVDPGQWNYGEHFDSTDPNCEGAKTELRLGYIIAKAPLLRHSSWVGYPNGEQRSSTLPEPRSGNTPYVIRANLGYLSTIQVPGSRPVMECRQAHIEEFFSSLDPNCEGHKVIRTMGYIYTSPPPGLRTAQVYRCLSSNGDHFDSRDPQCEGAKNEGLGGWIEIP